MGYGRFFTFKENGGIFKCCRAGQPGSAHVAEESAGFVAAFGAESSCTLPGRIHGNGGILRLPVGSVPESAIGAEHAVGQIKIVAAYSTLRNAGADTGVHRLKSDGIVSPVRGGSGGGGQHFQNQFGSQPNLIAHVQKAIRHGSKSAPVDIGSVYGIGIPDVPVVVPEKKFRVAAGENMVAAKHQFTLLASADSVLGLQTPVFPSGCGVLQPQRIKIAVHRSSPFSFWVSL